MQKLLQEMQILCRNFNSNILEISEYRWSILYLILENKDNMTVQELINALQGFNPDLEVTITDGFECRHYRGAFDAKLFEEQPGIYSVDIGIGGKLHEGD